MKASIPILLGIAAIVIISGCTQSGQITSDTNNITESSTQQQSNSNQQTCRTIQEPYVVQVPYLDQECEQIPYQDTEAYTSYVQSQVISATTETPWNLELGYYALGKVKLRNIDNKASWFTITFNWETLNDKHTDYVRHYIEPDETVTFESIYNIDMGEDVKYTYTYQSDVVQETRTVTKYRTECHDVTRYRAETQYRDKQVCD
jgi:hypothetical protein